jgi:serine protease Do
VRLLRITGLDLNVFEFDWDLTWACFFMNSQGKVYGRYGGRDARGADTRNTLAGLRYAMRAALEAHGRDPNVRPETRAAQALHIETLPAARFYRNGCIHCHQAKEILREERKNAGTWNRDELWTYPLPENIGVTLDLDRGNVVRAVAEKSPAQRVGIQTGDMLQRLNGIPVSSFADAQYALHKAPAKGSIEVAWLRERETRSGKLDLEKGWKKTNITWRPSLLDLLPSLPLFGDDLTPKEKKALGLSEKRLAFRQDNPVHSQARAAGVQEKDVIIGIDDLKMEMTMEDFLGYIRRNHLIGDRVTLNIVRAGKRIDLPMKLK